MQAVERDRAKLEAIRAAQEQFTPTPEMKQKILEEGLPSFRMGGSVNNFIAPEDINIFA